MSTYDDSSLFLYPSGYKASVLFAQKPMDASGQLAFTRSNDTATRVDENGLIEKVRTNLLTYSNDFSNAAWVKGSDTFIFAGFSDPFGGSNAWRITTGSGAGTFMSQAFTFAAVPYTFSIWAKANGNTNLTLQIANSAETSYVLTSDWQRISLTFTPTAGASTVVIGNGLSSVDALIYGSQLETSDFGPTPYIPTVAAAVSVGPLANIPRIDYLGGGCGKLLLEPQRTNLQTFSENIDNAVYGKTNVTISANATTSPDGYSNADKIVENTTNAVHRISGFGGVMSSGTTYTSSFFAKKAERDQVYILIPTSVAATRTVVVFNLTTGVSSVVSGSSATSHSMVDYGNGWYRCIATFTTTAVGTNLIGIYNGAEDYAGTTDFGLFLYGLMNEAGSYASSYVPTLAASVTRGADSCSKQNIAGTLPTAYPFTLFAEFEVTPASEGQALTFSNSALSNEYFSIDYSSGVYRALSRPSNTISLVSSTTAATVGMHKICGVFTSTTINLFVDGALVASGANAQTFNASINDIFVGQLRSVSDTGNRNSVKQALVFKSALSDADCIALTA